MKFAKRLLAAALLLAVFSAPAYAWNPKTASSIVSGAAQMMAKENNIPLTNLLGDVKAGAEASTGVIEKLIPSSASNPINAVESEMYLLEAVHGTRVDPYFAYRLGALGQLIANATSPMPTATTVYRSQYYADVDAHIASASIESSTRRTVDAVSYITALQSSAEARQTVLEADYKSGLGFDGTASQTLSQEVSRSMNAVADVWYTILSGKARVVNVSKEQMRDYFGGAVIFYVERGHAREAEASYERIKALGLLEPDFQKHIGDIFYDGGLYERAIQEYQSVLKQQPGRRDIAERLAAYYVTTGDEALDAGNLEDARMAFEKAVQADALNAEAKGKLIQAQSQLDDKTERMGAAQGAVETAVALEKQAEDLAAGSKVYDALETLKKARELYSSVGIEFSEQNRIAEAGIKAIESRMEQLRIQFLASAQNLSGAGSTGNAHILAEEKRPELAQKALHALDEQEYQTTLGQYVQNAFPGSTK